MSASSKQGSKFKPKKFKISEQEEIFQSYDILDETQLLKVIQQNLLRFEEVQYLAKIHKSKTSNKAKKYWMCINGKKLLKK